jgi:hypothetical protein
MNFMYSFVYSTSNFKCVLLAKHQKTKQTQRRQSLCVLKEDMQGIALHAMQLAYPKLNHSFWDKCNEEKGRPHY